MSLNRLIFRSLKKNIKTYYLYVFALIFSAALYFSFVTLQYNPSMDMVEGNIKGEAGIRTASVILLIIVTVFLLYANSIFIKRRSKEIGLFQLIGMTKNKVFQLLSVENFIFYYSSLAVGIFVGFASSKLILLVLIKITGVNAVATLMFSQEALLQTMIVFSIIYILMLLANYLYIKKHNILSLFRILSSTEEKVKKVSFLEMVIGILGIVCIVIGYYVSSILFSGEISAANLFGAMLFVLGSVILGTYLFYKGSVRFILYLLRKSKGGYLSVNEVLSLSSLMFRMKSNALMLTIITTVSALAIGLLSLSYISYYSAEQNAMDQIPDDFVLTNLEDASVFEESLKTSAIPYDKKQIEVLHATLNIEQILETMMDGVNFDPNYMTLSVVRDEDIKGINVSPQETVFAGYSSVLQSYMKLRSSGEVYWETRDENISQQYLGLKEESVVSTDFSNGGLPTAVVDGEVFDRLKKHADPEIQEDFSVYVGINIERQADQEKAQSIFKNMDFSEDPHHSQESKSISLKRSMGLAMFSAGFLGLAFLITSGCILYFKQMDESEEEKRNYTILRKLGFTRDDLLKGIKWKQFFNFGIPLVIGLLHSYFAVKSGWFWFGTEMWTPMVIVMIFYTLLYSIFGLLSILYAKQVVKDAL